MDRQFIFIKDMAYKNGIIKKNTLLTIGHGMVMIDGMPIVPSEVNNFLTLIKKEEKDKEYIEEIGFIKNQC